MYSNCKISCRILLLSHQLLFQLVRNHYKILKLEPHSSAKLEEHLSPTLTILNLESKFLGSTTDKNDGRQANDILLFFMYSAKSNSESVTSLFEISKRYPEADLGIFLLWLHQIQMMKIAILFLQLQSQNLI